MRTFYIPHVPTRFVQMLNARVPVFDVSELELRGELRRCVSQECASRHLDYDAAFREIAEAMDGFKEDDAVVCAGDPVLLAVVMSHAAQRAKRINVLRFSRSTSTPTCIAPSSPRLSAL